MIKLYCEAIGMEVSPSKSIILTNGVLESLILNIKKFLPFPILYFGWGIKYLGYNLNAKSYRVVVFLCKVKKVEC